MPRKPTPAQIEAYRRNGTRSRGPKTGPGKARSSRNATVHGFTSRRLAIPAAPPEFLEAILNDYRPTSPDELQCLQDLANAHWQTRWCEIQERALYGGSQAPLAAYRLQSAAFVAIWKLAGSASRAAARLVGQFSKLRQAAKTQHVNRDNEPNAIRTNAKIATTNPTPSAPTQIATTNPTPSVPTQISTTNPTPSAPT